MLSIVSLPDELLLAILTEAIYVRSVRRALRLRLVCRRFANLATTAIYHSRVLDSAVTEHTDRAPEFWLEYLTHLAVAHNTQKNSRLRTLIHIAQYICRFRNANSSRTGTADTPIAEYELKDCIIELCKMMVPPIGGAYEIRNMVAVSESNDKTENGIATGTIITTETDVSETALQYNRDLLCAASWLGETSLAAKLLEEGYNWYGSEFLQPARAASYRGHAEILKLILADDVVRRPYKTTNPVWIVRYCNDHPEILDAAIQLQLKPPEAYPGALEDLRKYILTQTRSPDIFRQLLKQLKQHDPRHHIYWTGHNDERDPYVEPRYYSWFSDRVYTAVEKGETDLLEYLLEEDKVEDIDEGHLNDLPILQSRFTVGFVTVSKSPDGAVTHLSQAARRGDAQAVRILINAGMKPDCAIEYAAMCGSRTIVRLLWHYGGYRKEAVQGAFAMAVDREDTAMFNLLIELGARLDDDVRLAILQKAKEDGLESMVELLATSG